VSIVCRVNIYKLQKMYVERIDGSGQWRNANSWDYSNSYVIKACWGGR
jgi:hypothetical protein